MTCKVEREDGALKSMTFTCDYEGCDASHDDTEIAKGGGLRAMGWHCPGGRHYCPTHAEEAHIK